MFNLNHILESDFNYLQTPEPNLVYNNPIPVISDREEFFQCFLVISDLHILPTEPKNRNGIMINRTLQLLDELIMLIKINNMKGRNLRWQYNQKQVH